MWWACNQLKSITEESEQLTVESSYASQISVVSPWGQGRYSRGPLVRADLLLSLLKNPASPPH